MCVHKHNLQIDPWNSSSFRLWSKFRAYMKDKWFPFGWFLWEELAQWTDESVWLQRLLVCLEEAIYIHNIKDMKLLKTILDIPANPTGELQNQGGCPPSLPTLVSPPPAPFTGWIPSLLENLRQYFYGFWVSVVFTWEVSLHGGKSQLC